MNRVTKLLTASAAAAALALATAPPASAYTPKNGILEAGEMGFWSFAGSLGSVFDIRSAENNFAGNTYRRGPSAGQSVNNSTLSYTNRDTLTWYVYTSSFRGGVRGSIPSGHRGDASADFRNNISSAYHNL
ncbi:hypothetical protein PJ985_02345 [Streptomyces sp. ACA25]|uniref:hypothetical protein n=1 Tax=Streptomyces sp. ACA25 TaxID=3022596 RepID=UPI002307918A|nr:hypothetical protein [Streptomyces sp. ACA25]MDB1086415.1 hypothetical protein [Streptomyces sp. ACA25]